MLKKLRTFIITLAAGVALTVPFAVPAVVSAADIQSNLCSGTDLSLSGDGASCADPATSQSKLDGIITTVVNIFSIVVGIIAVIMIVMGGLKYITSGGDSGNITGAKNTILYAIVGLVIVALAQFIVHFVLSKAQIA